MRSGGHERAMSRCHQLVLIVWAVALSTCGLRAMAQIASSGAHYVSREGGKKRVIVLVHGFTGNADTSWKNSNGTSFPDLLASDVRIKQADIFVASYETHWREENSKISNLADALFQELTSMGVVTEHRDLVFLCHSLGGLVVERMLIDRPEIAAKTSFIQFFGTPHQGAFSEVTNPIASFIAAFGSNHVIPELRAGSGNKILVELDQEWRSRNLSNVHRFCAIEAYPTHLSHIQSFSGLVVPYFSGAYGCDGNVPIDTVYTDHINMVKITGREGKGNEAYLIFLRNYRDNQYYEEVTSSDSERSRHEYLDVDCNHTKSAMDYQITFPLNSQFRERLISAVALLEDRKNIKDVNPDPPLVTKIEGSTVHIQFGFNGLDKQISGCPGGGHAVLTVRPTIQGHIPLLDGQ